MTAWLHRTTKVTHDILSPTQMAQRYPALVFVDGQGLAISNAEWIFSPDLTAVQGQPKKYWTITGDVVSLMNSTEQADVDTAEAQAVLDDARAEAVSRASLDISTREIFQVLLFEINKCNTRIQELQDVNTAMKQSTGGTANLRLVIPDPSATTNPAPATFTRVNPKLRSEVLQDYVDGVNAGDGDP